MEKIDRLEEMLGWEKFKGYIKGGVIGILIGVFGYKGCDAILDDSNYSPKGITVEKSVETEFKGRAYVKSGMNLYEEKIYEIHYPGGMRLRFTLDKEDGSIENYLIDITEENAEKESKYWQERMSPYMSNVKINRK